MKCPSISVLLPLSFGNNSVSLSARRRNCASISPTVSTHCINKHYHEKASFCLTGCPLGRRYAGCPRAPQHRSLPRRRYGTDGYFRPLHHRPQRRTPTPATERLVSHAQHGTAGRARNMLLHLLCPKCQLAFAHVHHDRTERGTPPHHQLDKRRKQQPRPIRSLRMELAGPEGRCTNLSRRTESSRIQDHPRGQGALRMQGQRRRRPYPTGF